jgi:hypothetical protein
LSSLADDDRLLFYLYNKVENFYININKKTYTAFKFLSFLSFTSNLKQFLNLFYVNLNEYQ